MSVTVTKPVFDYLFKHLVFIHDKKIRIINSYSANYQVYMQMLDFLKSYIEFMERFLGDVEVGDGEDTLPFVFFDCIFHLSDPDTGESLVCSVVLPIDENENSVQSGHIKHIPCNEPLASELVFKKRGDIIVFEEDGKSSRYTIKSIEANPRFPIKVF